jgi:predicted dehydrogenase
MAAAAVKAGKAVYVEKPLSLTIHEGRLLADVVERYNGILQVGSQQRSDEKFIKACELVRNGRIGELKKVKVTIYARSGNDNPWRPQAVPRELDYDMWVGPAPFSPYHKDRVHYKFRFVTDFSGGDMTNWGAHHLDIAQWALDADDSGPVEITGRGKRNAHGIHDTFYDIAVDLKYAGGVTVELRSGDTEVGTGGLRFEGTDGWIEVSRSKLDAGPKSLLTSRIGPDEIHLAPEGGGGTHMGIWLDCVRARSAKGINVPAEVGHRSATICHLANIVMELGRELRWDPVEEQFVDDDHANRLCRRPMREPWRV